LSGGVRRGLIRIGGTLALVIAAGSFAIVRWDNKQTNKQTTREVVVVQSPIGVASFVDSVPVFYIENKTRKPTSCADVTITKLTTGLFSAIARSDDGTWTIELTVVDDLAAENSAEMPTNNSVPTKSLAGRLRIEAQAVGGTDTEDQAIMIEALNAADLATSGDPKSIKVTWPKGYREVSRGVPWKVTGYPSESVFDSESDNDASTGYDLSSRVSLTWNSIDGLGTSFSTGVISAADSPALFAAKTIEGYGLTVFLSGDSATQSEVDKLAANIQSTSFRCPAVVSNDTVDTSTMTRVVGRDWVAYFDNSPPSKEQCAIPEATIFEGSKFPVTVRFLGCSPKQAFSVERATHSTTDSEVIAFVSKSPVASIRLREPSGRVLSSYDVVRAADSAFGVAAGEFSSTVGVDVIVIEALDGNGSTVEAASFRLGCRYSEACSPLHQLLSQPAIPIENASDETYASSLHVGIADVPEKPFPSRTTSVGPVEFATTSRQWCAVLDVISVVTGDGGSGDRDGMAACTPMDGLAPDTLTVETETLDYVGAMSMSVVVIGPGISKVRVTVDGSSETFDVHRYQPGPGAVSFYDPSDYGEKPVTYEGLNSTGQVIATTRTT
jgi:hypothetical protein